MYHSVIFGDKNTWDDWHLIPASRPFVSPPQVNASNIDIPGMNGTLDMTEMLTGYPLYKNRTGSLQFYVMHEYWKNWSLTYSEIMEYLHGKRMTMVLEDDPGYYYEGRFAVNQWASGQDYSTITINYDVYPYKFSFNAASDEDWLWDPFDFENGVIRNLRNLAIEGSRTVELFGDPEPVVPTITATIADGASLTVEHEYPYENPEDPNRRNGTLNTFDIANGENVFRKLIIREGNNRLTFIGYGTVSIGYKGGRF